MRAIVTYHSIDGSGSAISIDVETFERQLEALIERGIPVLPLERLATVPPGGSAVALTFDDALVSFAERAWPALRRRGLPVTVFAPVDRLGSDNAWGGRAEAGIPRVEVLDGEALRRLVGEGLAVGSHGVTHRDLRELPAEALERELEESRDRLEALTGVRPRAIAYPYGGVDRRVAAAARRHYELGVTTVLRPLRAGEDALLLPRLDAWYLRGPGWPDAWGTRRMRTYLAARRTLRAARRALQFR
jgi:peptidoglycan/xylan/chitin deacetylase (PgdA/CDA1 family)